MTPYHLFLIDSPANTIWRSPFLCQIPPARVEGFNQSNLLLPPPTFQLLLAIDGSSNIIKALEVDEAIAAVLASEPLKLAALVFQNSPVEIVGHSNVKSARAAADDVDAVVVFFHKFTGAIELSS